MGTTLKARSGAEQGKRIKIRLLPVALIPRPFLPNRCVYARQGEGVTDAVGQEVPMAAVVAEEPIAGPQGGGTSQGRSKDESADGAAVSG